MSEAIDNNTVLTIEKVESIYLTQRTHGSTKTQIFDEISSKESDSPIKNDSYVDALELTDYMFSRTQTSLKILTGSFGTTFLSTLKKNFKNAMRRVQEQGNQVQIIIIETMKEHQEETNQSDSYFSELSQENNIGIDIRYGYISENTQINHMILADDKMTRFEQCHKEISNESPAEEIQADVYLNSPITNKIQTEYFDAVWKKLQ